MIESRRYKHTDRRGNAPDNQACSRHTERNGLYLSEGDVRRCGICFLAPVLFAASIILNQSHCGNLRASKTSSALSPWLARNQSAVEDLFGEVKRAAPKRQE
jgi:hypothetical protein